MINAQFYSILVCFLCDYVKLAWSTLDQSILVIF